MLAKTNFMKTKFIPGFFLVVSAFFLSAESAYGSNPSGWVVVSEFGRNRLIGISTALFCFIVFGAIPFRRYWNRFFINNEKVQLTFRSSMTFCFFSGTVMAIVFMASTGIQQLISTDRGSPFQLQCVTQKKAGDDETTDREEGGRGHEDLDRLRYESILRLRDALIAYAADHEDKLPETLELPEFEDCKRVPFASGIRYEYEKDSSKKYLAREPACLPDSKYAIGRVFNIVAGQEVEP